MSVFWGGFAKWRWMYFVTFPRLVSKLLKTGSGEEGRNKHTKGEKTKTKKTFGVI